MMKTVTDIIKVKWNQLPVPESVIDISMWKRIIYRHKKNLKDDCDKL